MDHSEGMNKPIYNGDTQAERKCLCRHPHHTSGCDAGDTLAGKVVIS